MKSKRKWKTHGKPGFYKMWLGIIINIQYHSPSFLAQLWYRVPETDLKIILVFVHASAVHSETTVLSKITLDPNQ